MSVEAVSQIAAEGELASAPTPIASESEIVALLKEQNALLRELLAATRPPTPDPAIAKARAVAANVPPTDEAPYVAVNTATGEYAVGRTMTAAAASLDAPPGDGLVLRAGGAPVRIQTPRIGER